MEKGDILTGDDVEDVETGPSGHGLYWRHGRVNDGRHP